MKFAYASFGCRCLPDYYQEIEMRCYEAGQQWARTHIKLPSIAKVGDRSVPVVRSSHPFAMAFVAGFKSVSE
ncbi:MAG: hypothetical protein ACHWZW_02855 [Spirulina sp.]